MWRNQDHSNQFREGTKRTDRVSDEPSRQRCCREMSEKQLAPESPCVCPNSILPQFLVFYLTSAVERQCEETLPLLLSFMQRSTKDVSPFESKRCCLKDGVSKG